MVYITARSAYGTKTATYSLNEGHLVLKDRGEHVNLVGMGLVGTFETLTVEQSKATLREWNKDRPDHEPDGCHLCTLQYYLTEDEQ